MDIISKKMFLVILTYCSRAIEMHANNDRERLYDI